MHPENGDWSDFTRTNYRRLLQIAARTYGLTPVAEFDGSAGAGIWRHDVDASPQSALSLARIESEEGVRATYYFNLRSEFYNLLEPAVVRIAREIRDLGHEVGVHFDAAAADLDSVATLERDLAIERDVLRRLIGVEVASFSFHNPSQRTAPFAAPTYAGMRNAYAKDLMARVAYCSDSNGYWRYTPLEEFLRMGHESVCVLTHPEWWQDEPLSPRERIVRCVEGRAAATLERYDTLLLVNDRKNVR